MGICTASPDEDGVLGGISGLRCAVELVCVSEYRISHNGGSCKMASLAEIRCASLHLLKNLAFGAKSLYEPCSSLSPAPLHSSYSVLGGLHVLL